MSKPTPLSRTKKTVSIPSRVQPKAMCGAGDLEEYF